LEEKTRQRAEVLDASAILPSYDKDNMDKKELVRKRISIVNKDGMVVPFVRNSVQRYFAEHKTNRNIVLKSRQLGISSEILADHYAECITVPNTPCVVVSHETRATQRLLDRVHFFYNTFPDPRPEIGAESRSEISFPGLNSSIYIGTAGSRAFGRGDTLRKAHLSELAFYEDPERILAGVQDAVPYSGEITIECTPNGMDDCFYPLWTRTREGKTPYRAFFFPWWLDEDYSLPRDSLIALEEDRGELHYSSEEQELVDRHHLTEDQIRWRRWKISEKGGQFYQDFPEDEVMCFQQSGEPVFDSYLVGELAKGCYDGDKDPSGLVIWIPPVEKETYLLAVDSATGVEGGSQSAAVVLDCLYRVCATYQGKPEMIQFANMLKEWGKLYNKAEIVVERNNPGYTILSHLVDYPNVYLQRDFTTGKIMNKPGWWTSGVTKDFMINSFKEMLPKFKTWDMNLVRQIRGYRFVRYIPTAQASDDLAMAAMMAVAVRKMLGTAKGYQGSVPGWNW